MVSLIGIVCVGITLLRGLGADEADLVVMFAGRLADPLILL